MSMPLDPKAKLGESEMSWGYGLQPHPDSDFAGGKPPFPEAEPVDAEFWDAVAIRRSDPTVGDESTRDLKFAKGNPDRFGGQPPIVQEAALPNEKADTTPEPKIRVERED